MFTNDEKWKYKSAPIIEPFIKEEWRKGVFRLYVLRVIEGCLKMGEAWPAACSRSGVTSNLKRQVEGEVGQNPLNREGSGAKTDGFDKKTTELLNKKRLVQWCLVFLNDMPNFDDSIWLRAQTWVLQGRYPLLVRKSLKSGSLIGASASSRYNGSRFKASGGVLILRSRIGLRRQIICLRLSGGSLGTMRLMMSRSLNASQSSPLPSSYLMSCRVLSTLICNLVSSIMNINYIYWMVYL